MFCLYSKNKYKIFKTYFVYIKKTIEDREQISKELFTKLNCVQQRKQKEEVRRKQQ